jgi:hypothetical protein
MTASLSAGGHPRRGVAADDSRPRPKAALFTIARAVVD